MVGEVPIGCHIIQCFIPNGMPPLAPEKWWKNRAIAAGLHPLVNRDAGVGRCCRLRGGVGQTGLLCFEMGMPWRDGVTGALRILGGADNRCVRL